MKFSQYSSHRSSRRNHFNPAKGLGHFLLLSMMITGWVPVAAFEEGPILSVEFAVVGLSSTEVRGLYFDSDGESVPLRLSPAYITPGYRYLGANPLIIYRKEPDAEGQIQKIPAASVEIPSGWTDLLLLFVRDGGEGGRSYRVFAVDNSESAFPYGSYRLYNMTTDPVRGMIGDQPFSMGGSSEALITPQGENGERLNVAFMRQREGEWKLEIQTAWFYRSGSRALGFIYERDERSGSLGIRMLSQHRDNTKR